jgi:hypothetical protein
MRTYKHISYKRVLYAYIQTYIHINVPYMHTYKHIHII